MSLIKSISGIRGTIGGQPGVSLSPLDIVRFTAAYASLISKEGSRACTVVVGRDARLSGDMVRELVCGTLRACGCHVIDIGMATTPTTEMAVTFAHAQGGIILTASHNPRQWNALKLLDHNGTFFDAAAGARLLELAAQEQFHFVEVDHLGTYTQTEYTQAHIEAVLSHPLVDVEAIYRAGFTAVVDGINSIGGVVIPQLLEALGVACHKIHCEPTGQFAHNPEPLPAHLVDLSQAVLEKGADLGISVDPDVDRLAIVCQDGTMFGEEYTLVACADYVLARTAAQSPDAPLHTASNLSSSRALKDVTEQHGGTYTAAAVGEVNVVTEMKRRGCVIGGEGNGGVILPSLHPGRDALIGVALFLSHLAHKKCTVSDLRDSYPAYYMSKNRVEVAPNTDVDAAFERVKAAFANEQINTLDGLRIDFEENKEWVCLRKSNTEPIVRIYAESPTRQGAELLAAKIKDLL